MSSIGHNGGPGADVPDMAYVKFYPGDFLNGTAHMSLELRGAYITTLCVMYDRMGGFPYDEREGGVLLRVDKRVYRRVRDQLIADGKFYRDGTVIRNVRVEREIASYITEYRRRSEAAKKREAEKRQQQSSPELTPEVQRTSTELTPEVQDKFGELKAKKSTKTTTQTAEHDHIPESRSQNPEARRKKNDEVGRGNEFDLDQLSERLIGACNGALDNPVNCLGLVNLAIPLTWIREGCDLEMDIIPTLHAYGKKKHGARIGSWNYFTKGIEQARDQRLTGILPPTKRGGKKTQIQETYVERMRRLGGFGDDKAEIQDIEILPPETAQ